MIEYLTLFAIAPLFALIAVAFWKIAAAFFMPSK